MKFSCARAVICAEEVLNLFEARVNLLTEELNRQRHERHRHKQQQRQPPVEHEHQRQHEDHDKHRLQRVHDHRPGELPDGGQIVCGARHQIAGAMFVKERERLIDEVRVKILTHVVFDVARHADQNAALQKEKEAADETCAKNLRGRDDEFRPRDFSPVRVNCLADKERDEKAGRQRWRRCRLFRA